MNSNALSAEQIQRLVQALEIWVARHPAADDPVLSFMSGKPLSPRQIVDEVSASTPDGRSFLRMVQVGLEVLSFEQLLAGFVIQPNAGREAGRFGMGGGMGGMGRGGGPRGAGPWAGGEHGFGEGEGLGERGTRGPWAGRGGARGPGAPAGRTDESSPDVSEGAAARKES